MNEEIRKSLNRSIGLDRYIAKKDACKDYEQHTTSFIFADGYSEGFEEGFKDGAKWGMEQLREDFQQGKITCAGMTIQEIMNLKKENAELKKQWHDCFLSCSSPYCAGHFRDVKCEGELGNMSKHE